MTACAAGLVAGAFGLVCLNGFLFAALVYAAVTAALAARVALTPVPVFEGKYDVLTEALTPFLMVRPTA